MKNKIVRKDFCEGTFYRAFFCCSHPATWILQRIFSSSSRGELVQRSPRLLTSIQFYRAIPCATTKGKKKKRRGKRERERERERKGGGRGRERERERKRGRGTVERWATTCCYSSIRLGRLHLPFCLPLTLFSRERKKEKRIDGWRKRREE